MWNPWSVFLEAAKSVVKSQMALQTSLPAGSGTEDIRELKPLEIFPALPPYFFIVLAAVIVTALIGIGIFLWKRKKSGHAISERPLKDRILEALRVLRKQDLYKKNQEKLFHFQLSEIFRSYLEERYQLAATDLTTEEIIAKLPQLSLSLSSIETIKNILQATDRIKFSDATMSPESAEALETDVEKFVQTTAKILSGDIPS